MVSGHVIIKCIVIQNKVACAMQCIKIMPPPRPSGKGITTIPRNIDTAAKLHNKHSYFLTSPENELVLGWDSPTLKLYYLTL